MAAGKVYTYNLAQVLFSVGGVPIQGFGADDAMTYSPDANVNEKTIGGDGEVTVSANNNRSGTLTVTLMASSPANAVFGARLLAAKNLGVGDKFSIFAKDLNLGTQISAPVAWIEAEPDVTFGREVSERVWVLGVGNATIIHNGASLPTP